MSHTPGPWRMSPRGSGIWAGGYPAISVAELIGDEMTERLANARLIAAAPEMLALLSAILEQDIPPSLRVQIDTLLARVEGT